MRTQDPKQDNPQDHRNEKTEMTEMITHKPKQDNHKETKERREQVEPLVKAKEALETELEKISDGKVSLDIEYGLFYAVIETQMGGFVDGLVREKKEKENGIGVLKSEVKEPRMKVETERHGGARQMGYGDEKWRSMINSGHKNLGGLDILSQKILVYGVRRGNLYYMELTEKGGSKLSQAHQTENQDRKHALVWLWHLRLGHLSFGYLKKLQPQLFSGLSNLDFHCEICELAKSHCIPYLPSLHKSLEPFAVIHSDAWGPAKIPSFSNARNFLSHHGIRHQTSCTYTPQQHGLAKRKNKQIMEIVRASLFGMNLPKYYWGEVVKSTAYLINRTPSSIIDFQSPQQKMESLLSVPHLPNLEPRVFGCTVYVHIPKVLRSKLDLCAKRCVFVGYSEFQKGYWCYDPHHRKVHVTLDASFRESEPYFSGGVLGSSLQGESNNKENEDIFELEEMRPSRDDNLEDCTDQNDLSNDPPMSLELPTPTPLIKESTENVSPRSPQVTLNPNPNEINEIPVLKNNVTNRYPQRLNRGVPKKQYEPDPKHKTKYPINNYISTHRLSESYAFTVNQLSNVSIPSNVQDALADPKWTKAMNEEMEALQKNNTWELCQLPTGKKKVGCKWVFTVKLKVDGSIDRYKARSTEWITTYQETFAPVAKMNTIWILISIAVNRDWTLQQFNVKNAFLNGDLEEEVYMELPPGVKTRRFSSTMKEFSYKQRNSDHTLFIKHKEGKVTTLIVYVDDMVLTGDDPEERKTLQQFLASKFEMKDLGQLKYFLGIEVSRSKTGICLSQRKYVLNLLAETGMLACKPVDTPMEINHKLGQAKNQRPTDKGCYQRLVGKLIYLSHTWPDIVYAVSVVSQFMHSPGEEHMKVVYRILRYIKSAPGRGLLFSKKEVQDIKGYTDSDWAGNQTDRRSTSGYFTFVEGNLVTWRSKKQKVVARSSAEAEFRGMAHGVCELLWIKHVLQDLGIDYETSMDLHCDNKAAIEIAHNPVQHDRTKHVEVDWHFIKENLDQKIIQFPFVWSEDQLADILTKTVSGRVFYDAISKMGMINIYAPS
uniref:Integrase catalytic domain-containing protein n=1 Tax=Salix viminalis TaxID=40686 RepID=A0A6N2MRA1_SALVM